jgi:hypothetical protein
MDLTSLGTYLVFLAFALICVCRRWWVRHPIFSCMVSKAFACRRRLCYTIVLVRNSVHAAHFLIHPVCKRRISCSRLTVSVYGDVYSSTVKESGSADGRDSRSHTMASDNHLVIGMTGLCLTNGAFDHLFNRSPLFVIPFVNLFSMVSISGNPVCKS